MNMYSERLQILVSKEQRRRLEREAKRRDASVASLIRDAIDAQLGRVGIDDKQRAVGRISAMRAGPYLEPEELRREIDAGRAEEIERGFPGPGER
jgi:hypothetical protein